MGRNSSVQRHYFDFNQKCKVTKINSFNYDLRHLPSKEFEESKALINVLLHHMINTL